MLNDITTWCCPKDPIWTSCLHSLTSFLLYMLPIMTNLPTRHTPITYLEASFHSFSKSFLRVYVCVYVYLCVTRHEWQYSNEDTVELPVNEEAHVNFSALPLQPVNDGSMTQAVYTCCRPSVCVSHLSLKCCCLPPSLRRVYVPVVIHCPTVSPLSLTRTHLVLYLGVQEDNWKHH